MSAPLVYLDHAATTPVDPRVVAAIAECLAGLPGNASATHAAGRAARERVEAARAHVAALIGAEEPAAIVFTSGATESDNLAVLGAARAAADRGRHLVTVRTEHRAVLDACARLEREGWRVTYLKPAPDGRVDPVQVRDALRADTTLVSVMLVNNEIGVVQDVPAIGAICRERGVLLHVDAAQAAGRVPIDVAVLGADLLSLSAHKIHGPAGVGALYVRRQPRPTLVPLQFGGGQEGGLRSGTLPVHQIVGMGEAYRLARELLPTEAPRLAAACERLWAGIEPLGGVHRNGAAGARAPHILSVSFEGVDGEALLDALDDLALASGAACSSATREPSYVLRALGRDAALAQATLRFSVGRTTTDADVARAIERVRAEVLRLRALAPGGRAAPAGAGWFHGEAREPLSGTHVRWHLRVVGDSIAAAVWEARGCPDTLAAAARVAERLEGRAVAAPAIDFRALAAEISLPDEKLGRLFVIEDALRAAALQVRSAQA
jgi:cysteine desulfurase